ncbi:lipid-A-disaccharide synthase [Salmonella enterica subsp. arizonae]|uniref:Lipid-A-disaccharide synthase n=1 Tax=Salmonella enterica subsp. arizonae TaxID=59203 RepID=A0A379TFC4_SALER|nr:lipid-A-disaccharide synthase [Salmonella enterica subsp. arizonae]
MNRKKLAEALLPLLANGKTSHVMHDTFRELHQQIRCNADEQAADAVLEFSNNDRICLSTHPF